MDVLFISSMPPVGALSVEVGCWGSVMFSAWKGSKPTPPIFPGSELVTGSEALPMFLLKLPPLSPLIHFFLIKHKAGEKVQANHIVRLHLLC